MFPQLNARESVIAELGFDKTKMPQLEKYLEHLWKSNENLNLISRQMTEQELIDNHVIDCLLALRYFPTELRNVSDFGSGGGLPGILLAIQFPDTQFRLYDKSPKKQIFLKSCQAIVTNIEVCGEIPSNPPQTELIIARAFKPIDVLLEISREYYQRNGKYFLLKGRREKIDEEISLAKKKFPKLTPKITQLHSPVINVERHLVEL